ncbi:MAG: hypothetical protein E7486_00030 [Ruminococcaceae bacterium]|nr:hypothetical protein [Oscillospiraceae bacterium]
MKKEGIFFKNLWGDYAVYVLIIINDVLLRVGTALSLTPLLLIVLSFSILFTDCTCVKDFAGAEAEQQYACVENKPDQMPEISEVGRLVKIEYYDVHRWYAIFETDVDYLFCHYEPDEYETQKSIVEEKYIFQKETITQFGSTCEPMVEFDGYQWKILATEEYGLDFPKEVILIGCSDEAREIVYISYEDIDLDFVTSLEDFIRDDCRWGDVQKRKKGWRFFGLLS